MSIPKYKVGDVIYIAERNEPITITSVISTPERVGYGGSYIVYYQGNPVNMSYGWISESLITKWVISREMN
jgi:hypothetical protein